LRSGNTRHERCDRSRLAGPEDAARDGFMVQINHVLCPVDFSDSSRRALDHAIAIATWYGSRLTVMYVHHVPMSGLALASPLAPAAMEGLVLSPAERDQLRQELRAFTPADAVKNIAVEFSVAEGDIAGEILGEAQSADMVVMGTHGRSGFEHLMLGSATEKVLRKVNSPLLTIARATADATDTIPALFHHIVAAVDFSDASLRALTFAISLAEEADAHLTLLHVIDLPQELEAWIAESEQGRTHLEQWRQASMTRLHDLVPDEARTYCHVDERVEMGQAYRQVLRVAAERRAGLIVIGAHGRGVVERMFVGSTAQHIVRQAVCPVLTIRKPLAEDLR
jgi:nucleotide-binding universal stress UspA family protein